MVNKYATAAGKKYETDLMKYLREQELDVERLRLSGAEDEGDLVVRHAGYRWVIEAKREKGFYLGTWIKEATVERSSYALHRQISTPYPRMLVVHNAKGKSIGQSYVTTTLDEWVTWL